METSGGPLLPEGNPISTAESQDNRSSSPRCSHISSPLRTNSWSSWRTGSFVKDDRFQGSTTWRTDSSVTNLDGLQQSTRWRTDSFTVNVDGLQESTRWRPDSFVGGEGLQASTRWRTDSLLNGDALQGTAKSQASADMLPLRVQRTKTYDIQVRKLNYKLPKSSHMLLTRYRSKLRKLRRFVTRKIHGNPQLPDTATVHGGARANFDTQTCQQQKELNLHQADHQYILRDVSFDAKAGEILAIAGPSGAGKSTLLEILAGRIRPTGPSSVLVNNQAIDVAQFRRISGYVMQDDALFPVLTVRETLLFSARLRLPPSMSISLKKARVDALLVELGLEHAANTRIGNEVIRGVSGGERRRVSIGVDVVHDPSVLLLDEPTSGLDSAAAINIVAMLRTMAETRNCTVILSIHQPNFRILELMHSVLLLAEGTVVHHGSLEMLASRLEVNGHKIPIQVNVLEYAIEAVNTLKVENGKFSIEVKDRSSRFQPSSVTITVDTPQGVDPSAGATLGIASLKDEDTRISYKEDKVSFANSTILETTVLAIRCFKNISRTKELFTARSVQALAAGLTLGTIFINSTKGGSEGVQERLSFFAFSLTFFLSGSTEALPVFIQERQVFIRETSRGAYRISSYVLSNALVFAPFLIVIALIYSIPAYYIVKLDPSPSSFLLFTLIMWLVLLEANSFVSFFAALVPNFIMGNSLIAVCMGAFFLFSGYFLTKNRIPTYWLFAHYLSLLKYPLEALLLNEYQSESDTCFDSDNSSTFNTVGSGQSTRACSLTGSQVLEQVGITAGDHAEKWMDIGIMIMFTVFYRFLSYLVLYYKIYLRRR